VARFANVTSNLHTAEKLLAGMSRAEKAQVSMSLTRIDPPLLS